MTGLVAVNGVVTDAATAMLPALDRGVLYGDAVFEAFAAFGSTLIDAERHLARLRRSADVVGIPVPWSDSELEFELKGLLEQARLPKQHLRLVISRGVGFGLAPPLPPPTPTRVVYCLPAGAPDRRPYADGIALQRTLLPGTNRGAAAKTTGYLPAVLALGRARAAGFDDLLWTNGDAEVTEAATANIFFMSRQGDNVAFVTPPAHSGLLLGVTRHRVLDLLAAAKIPATEQLVYADELPRFDEAFLTSSVRGLVPVSRIDRHQLHTARPAAVYRHIERLFLTWVETQVGVRVDWASGLPVR